MIADLFAWFAYAVYELTGALPAALAPFYPQL